VANALLSGATTRFEEGTKPKLGLELVKESPCEVVTRKEKK